MRIPDQDVAALQSLGYNEDEARFLYIVATHSGYFVPRQFLVFCGGTWGYCTNHFASKLEGRGHAYWREYQGRCAVYHLSSKPLYTEIGKENLRNRRKHSIEFIRTRLVLLDFILANQDYDYLETEQQKIEYFYAQQGVPKNILPAKVYAGRPNTEPTVRYFVDKYPLFVSRSASASSPVITFSYIDPSYAGIAGFQNHLKAYLPLFQNLSGFRFLYIANSTALFQKAEQSFSDLVTSPFRSDISAEILRYFRLRKAWENKQYGLFADNDIKWLNKATKRFEGPRFETLRLAWAANQRTDAAVRLEFESKNPNRQIEFATYLIDSSAVVDRIRSKDQKLTSVPHFGPKNISLRARPEAKSTE